MVVEVAMQVLKAKLKDVVLNGCLHNGWLGGLGIAAVEHGC